MTTTITREQIEFASQNLSRDQSAREQSEQILLSFRKSPEVAACRDIWRIHTERYQVPSLNALRFAILQKWDAMTNEMRGDSTVLLDIFTAFADAPSSSAAASSSSRMSSVISSQIVSVLAALKRQWLDDDGKQR